MVETIPLVRILDAYRSRENLVHTAQELENHLRLRVQEITKNGSAALALSGGIDSAILAKFMPKGSTAYTFKCVVDGKEVIDESIQAQNTEAQDNKK